MGVDRLPHTTNNNRHSQQPTIMNRLRNLAMTAAVLMPAMVAAQSGTKTLTMEQAVMGFTLYPRTAMVQWQGESNNYVVRRGDTVETFDAKSGKQIDNAEPTTADRSRATGANALSSVKGGVAFTVDNNISYRDPEGKEVQVTSFDDRNIVSGQSVSRNEFGINGGLFFSPDGNRLAFYQKDESLVTDFPLLDITTRTGTLRNIKYPMNGMASEKVRTGVYNIDEGTTVYLQVDDFDAEQYHTNLTWSPDSKTIYLQVLDRKQKQMHLNSYDAATGERTATLLTEQSDKYVEPSWPLRFLKSDPNSFIYQTNARDGFTNLYLCTLDGKGGCTVDRLTKVDADCDFVAENGKELFYYSAEVSPVENHLFKVNLKTGKTIRLTPTEGWHRCSVSADGKYLIDSYQSLANPGVVEVASTDGKMRRTIDQAEDPCADYNFGAIEMGTVRSADGKYNNYYRLIKPADFDPSKKYPVVVYVYGGPHTQLVRNTFRGSLRMWEMLMAQKGYVVFVMDNRGTPNQGLAYEQATHRQLGVCEMEDQMKGIEWLTQHPWVDADRIGVHGWSYGGYMTISLMTHHPDVFKVGVAGGPVIDWKWYEVMYGERYMETAESNAGGFASTSLIAMAPQLKGKLLICQGAIDNTVVWEHSLSFVEACIKAGVQLDYFPYPTHEHNVGGVDRVHLMNKVTDYFDTFLR